MPDDVLAVAAVLLATMSRHADQQPAVDVARRAGADPVAIVLAHDTPAPRDARIARVKPNASWITGVRMGMALLTNTPARLALIWTPEGDSHGDAASLAALISAARESSAAVTAVDRAALSLGPVIVARDAWLDLLTLGEQGLDAVVARRGVTYMR